MKDEAVSVTRAPKFPKYAWINFTLKPLYMIDISYLVRVYISHYERPIHFFFWSYERYLTFSLCVNISYLISLRVYINVTNSWSWVAFYDFSLRKPKHSVRVVVHNSVPLVLLVAIQRNYAKNLVCRKSLVLIAVFISGATHVLFAKNMLSSNIEGSTPPKVRFSNPRYIYISSRSI